MNNKPEPGSAPSFHDTMQPLNVIRLAAGNIRARILPLLDGDQAAYLDEKLDRIERQVDRAAALLEAQRARPD